MEDGGNGLGRDSELASINQWLQDATRAKRTYLTVEKRKLKAYRCARAIIDTFQASKRNNLRVLGP